MCKRAFKVIVFSSLYHGDKEGAVNLSRNAMAWPGTSMHGILESKHNWANGVESQGGFLKKTWQVTYAYLKNCLSEKVS